MPPVQHQATHATEMSSETFSWRGLFSGSVSAFPPPPTVKTRARSGIDRMEHMHSIHIQIEHKYSYHQIYVPGYCKNCVPNVPLPVQMPTWYQVPGTLYQYDSSGRVSCFFRPSASRIMDIIYAYIGVLYVI